MTNGEHDIRSAGTVVCGLETCALFRETPCKQMTSSRQHRQVTHRSIAARSSTSVRWPEVLRTRCPRTLGQASKAGQLGQEPNLASVLLSLASNRQLHTTTAHRFIASDAKIFRLHSGSRHTLTSADSSRYSLSFCIQTHTQTTVQVALVNNCLTVQTCRAVSSTVDWFCVLKPRCYRQTTCILHSFMHACAFINHSGTKYKTANFHRIIYGGAVKAGIKYARVEMQVKK